MLIVIGLFRTLLYYFQISTEYMSDVLMGQKAGKTIPHSKSNLSSQDGTSSEDETDSAVPVKKQQKKKSKNKQKMPLFRKQSEKAKKRSDHQQWLVFDLEFFFNS